MLDEQGSQLLMELFNRMTVKQKNNVPDHIAAQIGDFMFLNGYRLVFNKWYLQEQPKT